MGWGFRKSISISKGIRLNLSKKGIGYSVGVKGMRIGVGSRGAYTRIGIPKTGLYSLNYGGKKSSSSVKDFSSDKNVALTYYTLVGIFGFIWLVSSPKSFIPILIISIIIYFFWKNQPKQKIKKKLTEAIKLSQQNYYRQSIVLLKEAELIDKYDPAVICLLGIVLYKDQQYNFAIDYLKRAVSLHSHDIELKTMLARCFYNSKKYDEAINILQNMPENSQDDLDIIKLLSSCFFAQAKYDLAIMTFKKAPLQKRKLNEELLDIHYSLGLVYEFTHDFKNAIKHFKKIYAVNTNYKDVSEKLDTLITK